MIEIALLLSVAGNVVLVVLLYLQQRDATSMAERLATRALAAEKTWNPGQELDTNPREAFQEKSDLAEWEEEQQRHRQIVKMHEGGIIPRGD